MSQKRLGFELDPLDRHLGGGLLPGRLTVIAGATGVGKTQIGLRWAEAGRSIEGRRGVLCDLSSRGDDQAHAEYARTQLDWGLTPHPIDQPFHPASLWSDDPPPGDFLHPFLRTGRRVTRRDLEPDAWHAWQGDLDRVLKASAAFFYANFIRGVRRVVIDGIEPTERMGDSIQFDFFEYVYHQVIRKESDWAARELLRENYRANADQVAARRYDEGSIGCLFLYTTPHVMLDDLMSSPIGEGDVFANANTIILMGRTKDEGSLGRGLFVAKHRGSYCGDSILNYTITGRGPEFREAK